MKPRVFIAILIILISLWGGTSVLAEEDSVCPPRALQKAAAQVRQKSRPKIDAKNWADPEEGITQADSLKRQLRQQAKLQKKDKAPALGEIDLLDGADQSPAALQDPGQDPGKAQVIADIDLSAKVLARLGREVQTESERSALKAKPFREMRQSVEYQLEQASELLKDKETKKEGLAIYSKIFREELKKEGELLYFGNSGFRAVFLWETPDKKRWVVKFPRYSRVNQQIWEYDQQLAQMQKLAKERGISEETAWEMVEKNWKPPGPAPALTERTYGEYLDVVKTYDRIEIADQGTEDALLKLGHLRVNGGLRGNSERSAIFGRYGLTVEPYVEGPTLFDVIVKYRLSKKLPKRTVIPYEELPNLLRVAVDFERGVTDGKNLSGPQSVMYARLRENIAEAGGLQKASGSLESLLLQGQSQVTEKWVDTNNGHNGIVDPRFWAKSLKEKRFLTQSECIGKTLLWIGAKNVARKLGTKGYCIDLNVTQFPTIIDK